MKTKWLILAGLLLTQTVLAETPVTRLPAEVVELLASPQYREALVVAERALIAGEEVRVVAYGSDQENTPGNRVTTRPYVVVAKRIVYQAGVALSDFGVIHGKAVRGRELGWVITEAYFMPDAEPAQPPQDR